MLKCKICNKEVHQLTNHIWNTHQIGQAQYRAWFGQDTQFISDELRETFRRSAQAHSNQIALNLAKSSKRQKGENS